MLWQPCPELQVGHLVLNQALVSQAQQAHSKAMEEEEEQGAYCEGIKIHSMGLAICAVIWRRRSRGSITRRHASFQGQFNAGLVLTQPVSTAVTLQVSDEDHSNEKDWCWRWLIIYWWSLIIYYYDNDHPSCCACSEINLSIVGTGPSLVASTSRQQITYLYIRWSIHADISHDDSCDEFYNAVLPGTPCGGQNNRLLQGQKIRWSVFWGGGERGGEGATQLGK